MEPFSFASSEAVEYPVTVRMLVSLSAFSVSHCVHVTAHYWCMRAY